MLNLKTFTEPATETVMIAGEDFTAWDRKARRIMDHLATHPTMPLREDRNPPAIRVMINMVLRAQSELRTQADGPLMVTIRDHAGRAFEIDCSTVISEAIEKMGFAKAHEEARRMSPSYARFFEMGLASEIGLALTEGAENAFAALRNEVSGDRSSR
jgi:hypothetical protein